MSLIRLSEITLRQQLFSLILYIFFCINEKRPKNFHLYKKISSRGSANTTLTIKNITAYNFRHNKTLQI